MPVMNKKNEYVIPVTLKCNWKCSYCAMNNKYDAKIDTSYDKTIERLNMIPNDCICTLTGGEPGLLEESTIEKYLSILRVKNVKTYLETNGTFIDKHPRLVNQFVEILYHCSQDLNNIVKYYPYDNIRYLIIITDENILRLDSFLAQNFKTHKFDMIPASYPFSDDIRGPLLSNKNRIHIFTHYSKYMTEDSLRRFYEDKDFEAITWMFRE